MFLKVPRGEMILTVPRGEMILTVLAIRGGGGGGCCGQWINRVLI